MSKDTLTIAKAEWSFTGTINDPNQLYIQGLGEGGINIPSTKAALSGSVISIANVAAEIAFPAQTKYYNPFTIQWQVSFDGGSTWQAAGTSTNAIYVCLTGPGPTPYRTVVHLACSKDGASTVDQAVANTWDLVKGRSVCKWNQATESYDIPLYYYKPGTTFAENFTTIPLLLNNAKNTGQCGAWAKLLQSAWALNGAKQNANEKESSFYTEATPKFNDAFWVTSWGKIPASGCLFDFQSPVFDMMPYPPSGQYGYYDTLGINMKNEASIPGQNSNADAPSQKVFINHQFIKYTKLDGTFAYYDPSYGVTYSGATKADCEADFQSVALVGFGNEATSPPNKLRYTFATKTATVLVTFDN